MPKRFEAYRMKDGVTPLSQDYFNPVFGDIDARIADMEERRADLQAVVDELTQFGLARIDTVVGPAMAEINTMLQALQLRRQQLEAAIGNIGDLATATAMAQEIADAIDAEATARATAIQAAVTAEAQARQLAIAAEATARGTAIALATAKPSAAAFTYDATARVSGITETLPAGAKATTLTYDAAGRVATVAQVQAGKTRTTTYTYGADSRVNSFSVVEA